MIWLAFAAGFGLGMGVFALMTLHILDNTLGDCASRPIDPKTGRPVP